MPIANSKIEVEVHEEEKEEAAEGGFMIGKKKMEFTSDNL